MTMTSRARDAASVPVLLFLMLGSAEMGRFVLLNQKMDRVATTVPDLVSRAETISESQVTDIMVAADQVADPFDLADLGVVIVTSITNSDGTGPVIAWQRSGAGSLFRHEQARRPGRHAGAARRLRHPRGETAIVSEVYYDFAPFLSSLIVEPQVIYGSARNRRAWARSTRSMPVEPAG
ncbi:MAG TPA: hypothetical protein VHQ91_04395 [Geminicoccaceae bacterium]|nr:hypothetical protein [Geminicoccaceae bacterium]